GRVAWGSPDADEADERNRGDPESFSAHLGSPNANCGKTDERKCSRQFVDGKGIMAAEGWKSVTAERHELSTNQLLCHNAAPVTPAHIRLIGASCGRIRGIVDDGA